MWYVVQTVGGQERKVLSLIEARRDECSLRELFIPEYEIMKRIQGEWVMRKEILLPGYVFADTRHPEKVEEVLRGIPKFTRLLGNDDMFLPLADSEVKFLNAFCSPGHRVIDCSSGIVEGDRTIILKGPLMGHTGLIKKIDRHKRLAYLEMSICGRIKSVRLGLEIVQKRN
uniref:Antiterminator LoaP n=1 Tax=Muribaculaceae bacterium Z82 TaxID=2304548 RepID=A0A7C9JEY7_9BACT